MSNRTPLKTRVQSPGHHLLTPNDDDYERAQVRKARAAALRRKSGIGAEIAAAGSGQATPSQDDFGVLSREHILELHNNCIKLAAENKITQRNTWDLKLIDHLSALVQGDDDEDDQTNFQKASCTLEAGVKIYSTRVDSVHSETYKVLGGLNRTAGDDNSNDQHGDKDGEEGEHNEEEHKKSSSKKHGISSSTLEASFDTLNVKKFDVAFTVDPLFQQTSAQFDEGGAKGLLLNTLSVYQGCEIVFDSWEVPEKSMKIQPKNDAERNAFISLSFMKDSIDGMMDNLLKEMEISPSLKEILKMLDDPYRATTEAEAAARQSSGVLEKEDTVSPWQDGNTGDEDDEFSEVFDTADPNVYEDDNDFGGGFETGGDSPGMNTWNDLNPGLEDEEGVLGDGELEDPEDGTMMSQRTVDWITSGLSVGDKSNSWAGPEHWKYRKPRDSQQSGGNGEDDDMETMKKKRKKRQPFVFDFENPPDIDMSIFNQSEDPRSTLLVQRRDSVNTLLPEDVHYEALNLVHLFLRPFVMCIRKRGARKADGQKGRDSFQDFGNDSGNEGGMGDFVGFDGDWAGEDGADDTQDPFSNDLVAAPRKVQKIDVNYDKTSKQVDVRILKETLWSRLQHIQKAPDIEEVDKDTTGIPFQRLLNILPEDCAAAAREDISVPLCFICLLHLANEHNLRITDCSTMDDLRIFKG